MIVSFFCGFFVQGSETAKVNLNPVDEISPYKSQVWTPDLCNGNYKNPILYADYSDPDVCYANGSYYMVASSFNCFPGLPILKSSDMVNWKIVSHAIYKSEPYDLFNKPQLGCGVWAPSIRYHNGYFYIFYGDPDYGIYMLKSKYAEGRWSKPVLVKPGKGIIDPCPLWDADGRVYLVHAYAGTRYGMKSLLAVCELSKDASMAIGEDVIIFDGHEGNPTCEGPKFYKQDGYYYIFFPAGGVKDGWQMAIRSKSVYGPYEGKKVMDKGNSEINGPHQGAWVRSPLGEDWFFHFQEKKPLGRVVLLQPMTWKNGWPVIGVDKDGDGCGEPVATYRKPKTDRQYPVMTPAESDEFNGYTLGKQWQWYANPKSTWVFCNGEKGYIRLFSDNPDENYKNLLNTPNLLLQKFPAPDFTATTKVRFCPNPETKGERCGLAIVGMDYAALTLQKIDDRYVLSQIICKNAEKGDEETVVQSDTLNTNEFFLRVKVSNIKDCTFSYSIDGKSFKSIGMPFTAREGTWIGAKVGLFCTRSVWKNDGGWMDADWFRVTR